jgi:outer membrane immunogenic protein
MRTSELEWEEGSFMKKNSKGFLLATAATGAAAFAPGALAADLPTKAPAMVVPPAASWAGFYIGVHAGANWQQSHNTALYAGSSLASRQTSTGFIGGGQIGYNWQSGNFVFGLEADGSWLSNKGNVTDLNYDIAAENKVRWLATVRPRFGLAVGNTMAYVTAGVAFGGVKNKLEFDPSSPGPFSSVTESKTRVGWAVGGGIEHMWTRNWTIALEGMFVDLGRKTVNHPFDSNKTTRFDNQIVIGRAKLNYKW